MFRIGEFSRLSRVSVKMLRHYDAIGLLPAAWVDPQTDYRYYSADQLPRLNRVLALKELGFSLEQIAYLLGAELSTGQMCRMLALRRSEIEQQMEAHQARLRLVDARLRQVEATGASPAYDVVLRRVERQQVASIRTVLPSLNAIERLFHEVETFATRRRCRAPRPPLLLYHDGTVVKKWAVCGSREKRAQIRGNDDVSKFILLGNVRCFHRFLMVLHHCPLRCNSTGAPHHHRALAPAQPAPRASSDPDPYRRRR